jgi:hypothetical protein
MTKFCIAFYEFYLSTRLTLHPEHLHSIGFYVLYKLYCWYIQAGLTCLLLLHKPLLHLGLLRQQLLYIYCVRYIINSTQCDWYISICYNVIGTSLSATVWLVHHHLLQCDWYIIIYYSVTGTSSSTTVWLVHQHLLQCDRYISICYSVTRNC